MRLSVRRFQPDAVVATFLGLLDIKLGCEIIILFALINKVAGVYGLIMLVLGVGTLSQFLFYAYSVITLIVFAWALRAIKSETAYRVLLATHIYLADHIIQTMFHYIFYYRYWYQVAHDGKRELNSQAQKDIFNLALSRNETEPIPAHGDAATAALANKVWAEEKGYAVGVTLFGFLLKVYFIVVLYSYAAHLRNSSYHSLPLTSRAHRAREARSGGGPQVASQADDIDLDLHDIDEHTDAAAAPSASSASSAPRAGNGGPGTKGAAGKGKGDDHDDFSWD